MKHFAFIVILIGLGASSNIFAKENIYSDSKINLNKNAVRVATFKGQQVTGVAVTDKGRIFVNFPRWRKGIENSVIEIDKNGKGSAFPDRAWNSWEAGSPPEENVFIGVQSVSARANQLYVLDTRDPGTKSVLDEPRVFVFDLSSKALVKTYKLGKESFYSDSYINDLNIDSKNSMIYFTDSRRPGLIVLDMKTGTSKRVLDAHYSTSAEVDHLTFNGVSKPSRVNSDGIALDIKNQRLFYHALSGYSLYSIDTETLIRGSGKDIENAVKFEGRTSAPDGMIFDAKENLYFADLENNRIMYRKPDGKIFTLLEGDAVKWADSFSIYGGWLYYTNSRINEAGKDISGMEFTLNKIRLPE